MLYAYVFVLSRTFAKFSNRFFFLSRIEPMSLDVFAEQSEKSDAQYHIDMYKRFFFSSIWLHNNTTTNLYDA